MNSASGCSTNFSNGRPRARNARADFDRLESLVGWAKARSLRAVPTALRPWWARFALPTLRRCINPRRNVVHHTRLPSGSPSIRRTVYPGLICRRPIHRRMRHMQRHKDDWGATGRDDLVRRVCRHDEHIALDDGLGVAARDRWAAEIVRIGALLIDEFATRHDVAPTFA